MKSFGSSADEMVAAQYMDLLRDHRHAQIEKDVDPSLRKANLHDVPVAMAAVIPAQPPLSMKIVGANVFKSPSVCKTNYTFEYQYPDRWLLISVATQKKDGVFTLVGFSAHQHKDSLEHMNRFTLARTSPWFLLFGAGCSRPLYGAWMISVCVPLGAIWFLLRRKSYLRAAGNQPLPPELPDAGAR